MVKAPLHGEVFEPGATVDGPPSAGEREERVFPPKEAVPLHGAPHKFSRGGAFWFYDETGDEQGPFFSQAELDYEFNRHLHYLETGRMLPSYNATPWQALDAIGQKLLREHIIPNDFGKVSLHTELLLFISEVIEIFEDERNGFVDSKKIPGFTAVEEEAADILLRVLSASANRGWRIGAAAAAKHAYNLTRPYKHGKKM